MARALTDAYDADIAEAGFMGPNLMELAGYAAGGAAGGLIYWAIRDSEALLARLWALLRTR